jgi:hypothetical protein
MDSMLFRGLGDSLAGNGILTPVNSPNIHASGPLTTFERLFAIEGAATVALSILVYLTLPDCMYKCLGNLS